MGNRAVITLDKKPTGESLGIYLHWNGGPESVLAFIEAAHKLGVRNPQSDPAYAFARLVQIIGNFFGGTTSIGVGKLKNLDCDNYDNGLMSISWTDLNAEIVQWSNGDYTVPGKLLDNAVIKNNPYWRKNSDGEDILSHILKANSTIDWT